MKTPYVSSSVRCIPIYPHPILLLEISKEEKYLVISDVHLGWEERLKKTGLATDLSDTVTEMVSILLEVQQRTAISNLIILGDLKSSTNIITKSEWNNVPLFINMLEKSFKILIIPGNHDGKLSYLLPKTTNLLLARGLQLEDILLIHGHTNPNISPRINRIITGHLHPILQKEESILNGSKVWVKLIVSRDNLTKTKPRDIRRIEVLILPHFNNLLDYYSSSRKIRHSIDSKSKLPFLDKMLFKQNWTAVEGHMFSTDGTLVGNLEDIMVLLYGSSFEQ